MPLFQALIVSNSDLTPSTAMTRFLLEVRIWRLISVFTLGRRFIRKWEWPVQAMMVPNECSTRLRRLISLLFGHFTKWLDRAFSVKPNPLIT